MEIDEDFLTLSKDKIEKFLSTKLDEIHKQNEFLEGALYTRKQKLQELKSHVATGSSLILIENSWKKIRNKKCVVAFELTSAKTIEDLKVVLNNNIDYLVKTFDIELACESKSFEGKAYVTIIFELQHCLDAETEVNISGDLYCLVDKERVYVKLPETLLSVKDTTSHFTSFIEKYALPNFLAVASSYSQYDLLMILPEGWTTPVTSTFEITCSLTYIPLNNSGYFVSNRVSEIFDRTVLVVRQHSSELFLNVYAEDEERLMFFLHHLQSRIIDCIVLPAECYYSVNKIRSQTCSYDDKRYEILKAFRSNMLKEVANYKTMYKLNLFSEQLQKISEIQRATDLSYLQAMDL